MTDGRGGRFGVNNLSGVFVEEIRVESPPFDRQDQLQDRVGRTGISEENFFPAEQFDPGMIQETINELSEMIGNPERFRVVYDMIIRGPSDPKFAGRRIALAKGRTFVRLNNPVSPEVISVSFRGEADLDFDPGSPPGTQEYRVQAMVKNF